MKAALSYLSQMDESAVHAGDVTRAELKDQAEEKGHSRTAGERAHRFIHAHQSPKPVIRDYVEGAKGSPASAGIDRRSGPARTQGLPLRRRGGPGRGKRGSKAWGRRFPPGTLRPQQRAPVARQVPAAR